MGLKELSPHDSPCRLSLGPGVVASLQLPVQGYRTVPVCSLYPAHALVNILFCTASWAMANGPAELSIPALDHEGNIHIVTLSMEQLRQYNHTLTRSVCDTGGTISHCTLQRTYGMKKSIPGKYKVASSIPGTKKKASRYHGQHVGLRAADPWLDLPQ